ncbi:hypothetical protein LV476_02740 [Guyparkeria hydrothermalis]|uniref:hypothetical protein n=1 Tax=Guyparkeria hydrothermalis TaxID=923 RepID=UPI002020DDC1|nr:hypothetical protein [Guyparkeria hydrothermalis]MCL7743871.1 hypothetical protein [Guyparkeria hydrothermalis]
MNDVTANLHPTGLDERRASDARRFAVMLAAGLLLGTAWPVAGHAAGSRAAVEAQPGEMVLLRAVPARHATRTMPPGRALMVNPSPESELESGLSHLEIANDSYGQVAAGGQGAPGGVVAGSMSSFMSPLGVGARGGDRTPAPRAATGGAMGAATGSIASQVTGALAGAGLMGQGGSR